MARIINWVPFHWAQSARQQPHYPVDNWSVLPFISTLNAIKYHYWLSNLQSALGSQRITNTRWMLTDVQSAVGFGAHRYFLPFSFSLFFFFMVFRGCYRLPGLDVISDVPEYFTPNRAVWKRWLYQRLVFLGLRTLNNVSAEPVWQ